MGKQASDFLYKRRSTIPVPNYGTLYPCGNPENMCGTCLGNWNYGHEWPYIEEIKKVLQPNSVGIDIGAHVGIYGIALSSLVSTMYSFEPEQSGYEALIMNSTLYPNIIPINFACGKSCSVETNYIILSEFLKGCNVDFIKIDVEGQEVEILNDLSLIINNDRELVMLVEFEMKHLISRGYNEFDFFNALKNCGLDCTNLFENIVKPNFTNGYMANIFIHRHSDHVDSKILRHYYN
jgi:hypothetical protein